MQPQTLLVFGSQSLSFDKRALTKLREDIHSTGRRTWVQETIAGLPAYLTALSNALPNIAETLPHQDRLQDFDRLLNQPLDTIEDQLNLSNLILTPLVVLSHLTEYERYLSTPDSTQRDPSSQVNEVDKGTSAIGFCTGLLSTFAVASSHTTQDLEKYGSVALRLAMMIGALVDADETQQEVLGNGRSTSYSVAWTTDAQEEKMHEILGRWYPEVYVSVRYDRARATVTSSGRAAATVAQELRAAGLAAVIEVPLQGRFHDPSGARKSVTDTLVELCGRTPEIQFAATPAMATTGGRPIAEGSQLHELAARSILVEHCDWYGTVKVARAASPSNPPRVVCFGSEKCIPPTLASQIHPIYQNSVGKGTKLPQQAAEDFSGLNEDNMIAVVGMSIKVAGADDVDEFAQMLRTGESQHQEIKTDNIDFNNPWRDDTGSRTWYTNFMKDRNAFDHSFFKMSPREAAAMDPQQRLFLQAAYQAVEQSGYFTRAYTSKEPEDSVAVYVGISTTDYDQHIACHDPSAYTSTGNLRAFLAGRVSHHFGWTGPAMTVDTACSSSAVAINMACQTIMSGESRAAIAGGVAVMDSPFWFQNLASASFLSPTGQCKPFDEKGDGYCRAEGIGAVMLKKLSTAKADGDQILGCIAATSVHQNQNCTPLVVPNKPSLAPLFQKVIAKSGLTPTDISLVEAHGTGTAVGDPAEYASIAHALNVAARSKPLFLGSVKGHIGHTEAAAGVVSLIKVLTMMNEGFIPPQASHTRLSPRITTASDMIQVSKVERAWDTAKKAALVNSYGASGSNTSMVVIKPTKVSARRLAAPQEGVALPFWIPGSDDRDIAAYCARLVEYIRSHPAVTLEDISFNLSRQLNRTLEKQLVLSARSVSELQSALSAENVTQVTPAERPVILCFGGQVSTFVGLNRAVYDEVTLLRQHLDECDRVMTGLGLDSIYPEIFSCEPIEDTVKLQCMLFAMQYSSARSWMDSGLGSKIAAVVGHSFGELTALCISGVLSVEDTVKLVSGRAQLIRDQWGSDKGAMVAVEGDETTIHQLLDEASQQTPEESPASIACYNGPRSFTLAGSTPAIQGVVETIRSKFGFLRHKQLNVTNSFHCSLADGIVEPLSALGEDLTFNLPTIHIEHAAALPTTGARLSSTFPAEHLRNPVFFNHAVQRLAQTYPNSVWLEAGSNSTITTMAGRALRATSGLATPGGPQPRQHFQALNITLGRGGLEGLTDATQALWKEGLRVSFWKHHSVQMDQYNHVILPPRQFAKTFHGLDITPGRAGQSAQQVAAPTNALWSFAGYEDSKGKLQPTDRQNLRRPRFLINHESEKFKALVQGHVMARTAAICPAGLELDMAIEAIFSLHPEFTEQKLQPMLLDMVNSAPFCLDPSRSFWLHLAATDDSRKLWDWSISSTPNGTTSSLLHVKGSLQFRSPEDAAYKAEFARLERLVSHKQCTGLLAMAGAPTGNWSNVEDEEVHVLQGRNVYQGFDDVISYTEQYRSLWRLVGQGNESAGCVRRKRSSETWLDVALSECFMQTGGIWVSCMTDRSPDDVFIAAGLEQWMRNPKLANAPANEGPELWHILARHQRVSARMYVTDVFVFDSTTGMLTEVILGTKFSRVPKTVMRQILGEFAPGAKHSEPAPVRQRRVEIEPREMPAAPGKKAAPPNLTEQVRQLLSSVSGIEPIKINPQAELADIGVDSLMSMELAREIEGVFKFSPDRSELLEADTLEKLTGFITVSLHGSSAASVEASSSNASVSDGDSNGETNPSTPAESLPGSDEFTHKLPVGLTPRTTTLEQAEEYVARYTEGFTAPTLTPTPKAQLNDSETGAVVVLTGATGSLGSNLVAGFARNPSVRTVVCLNRRSHIPPLVRQKEALSSRSITLTEAETAKLRVLEGSTADAQLGLPSDEYTWLAQNATHIVHNAWPMSLRRPIHTFIPQFKGLRNLLDLASEMASNQQTGSPTGSRIGFQLVSSISVVGSAPQQRVLEERVPLDSTLSLGYPEAKWVCERMLDETLHRYPNHFRPMVVRPGQITGPTDSCVWTTEEHMPFLIKSSQSMRAWPDLDGPLHWIPVDTVAGTMVDIVLPEIDHTNGNNREPEAYPVYHLDNPVGQPWKEMSLLMADALDIPVDRIIPYQEWLDMLRNSPLDRERDIPAAKITDFFTEYFEHMACGGVILDTSRSEEHSKCMAAQGPVSPDLARRYIQTWKKTGFLKQ
ncbi:hypothetical protein BJX99DRAFT_260752 [Aspergillus californicus]